MTVRVALLQMSSSSSLADNLQQAEPLIAQAAAGGAMYVQMPENALRFAPGESVEAFAEDAHPGVLRCREWAARHGIWLHIGSVAIQETEVTLPYNRSLLIAPSGAVGARYDKIHLFDVDLPNGERYEESARFAPGNAVCLAQTPLARIGLTVCYDLRFAELFRLLALRSAQIIAVPSAFTVFTGSAHWEVLLRARAIETGAFILAAAQVGQHPSGRSTYGHSLIVSPWGEIIAQASSHVPQTVIAELDLAQVEEMRARIPVLRHARLGLSEWNG